MRTCAAIWLSPSAVTSSDFSLRRLNGAIRLRLPPLLLRSLKNSSRSSTRPRKGRLCRYRSWSWNASVQFGAGLAAVVCVIGVSWLIVQNMATRSRIAELETERRDLGIREKELQRRLTEEQDRAGRLAAQIEKLPSPAET